MRNLVLALGALGVCLTAMVGACGTDVEEEPAPTTTPSGTASGGGGAGASGGATTSSTTSSQGGGCAGVEGDCEAACCKIETDCGLPVSCDMINQFMNGILDCEDNQPAADCLGACVLAAECEDIGAIAGGDIDAELCDCINQCPGGDALCGGCTQCLSQACTNEFGACQADTPCQGFLTCVQEDACADQACMTNCQNENPSAATDALVICTCDSCSAECPQCGGGSGGGGGNG